MLLCLICASTHPPAAFILWPMGNLNSLHNAWCPVTAKTSAPYWSINNKNREANKAFQHLFPSQLPCQKQGHEGKGQETHLGWLDPWCLQLSTRACRRTNKCWQGSRWPTFPPSHGVLCHCETATEFQLHNKDERDFKRPNAAWLTVQWQPLPWHPCLLPESLRRAQLELLHGAEVQPPRATPQRACTATHPHP